MISISARICLVLGLALQTGCLTGTGTLGLPTAAVTPINCWTAPGSTGILRNKGSREFIVLGKPVDPTLVDLGAGGGVLNTTDFDAVATLRNNTPKGIYQIRYPVPQQFIFRLSNQENFRYDLKLAARLKVGPKKSHRVVINLKRYELIREPIFNLIPGPEPIPSDKLEESDVVMTIDSDDFGEDPLGIFARHWFLNRSVSKDNVLLNFSEYAYYIDVQLISKLDPDPASHPVPTKPEFLAAVGAIQLCPPGVGMESQARKD